MFHFNIPMVISSTQRLYRGYLSKPIDLPEHHPYKSVGFNLVNTTPHIYIQWTSNNTSFPDRINTPGMGFYLFWHSRQLLITKYCVSSQKSICQAIEYPSCHLMIKMSHPVWFITGCSSGFGASLALFALRSGHKVIATSRNPSKSPELVSQIEELGGIWMKLDVCSAESEILKVLNEATNVYGRIDILVNNAGYALLGAFETIR